MVFDVNGISAVNGIVDAVSYGCDNTGITDKTTKIQLYLNEYTFCYFPKGTYIVSLPIYIPSEVTIYCEPGAVFLRSSNMTTMFTSAGDTTTTGYDGIHDVTIYGATFDTNGDTYTTACTSLGIVHAKNILIENCQFIRHTVSWHQIEFSAVKYGKIINCYFDANDTGENTETIQLDAPREGGSWPWDNASLDGTPCKYIEISGCDFYNGGVAIGDHGGNSEYINIHDCTFDTFKTRAVQHATAKKIMIHDCIAVDCTDFASGSYNAYNNMINGTFTA